MRVKEKSNFWSFLKTIFIDIDCPDGEEMDIENSNDPKMQELKKSLNRVDGMERNFYISSSSNPKSGRGNSIVERVNVDNNKVTSRRDGKGSNNVNETLNVGNNKVMRQEEENERA